MSTQAAVTGTATSAGAGASLWSRVDRTDLARVALVAAITAGALVAGWVGQQWLVVTLGVIGLVVGNWPIVVEAAADVRERRMSMELSMLIAIAAAAAIGEWITALVITVFVLAAEILEDLSMDRGRNALAELMEFLPDTVQVRDGGQVLTVPAAEVRSGQVVVVSPGGRVPVDGTVVAGRSSLDASRITGESLPVDVAAGAQVFAGSVNQTGVVDVRAERVGAQSAYGHIIAAVEQAQSTPPPVQRLADKLAARLVYLALTGAALTWIFSQDLRATISVVLVAGACGIAAGTPLAVLAAIARAARTGAFIKAGQHLETLSAVDTVIFDKTGTLTKGEVAVLEVHPAPGVEERELLRLAASAERHSEHPIGQAIVAHAGTLGVTVDEPAELDYQPGLGLTARVGDHTVRVGSTALVPEGTAQADAAVRAVHVAIEADYAGSLVLADTLRDSAQPAVADLHALGLRVVMLTGDTPAVAATVAAAVGIDDVRAGLLPEDKLTAVDAERAAGHLVAMVGDGVNDAPALARADVGIAMGSGTDIARDSADVELISSDLADLVATLHTARRARRIVTANFVGTITIDLVGMALAALGFLGPVLAAIVHVGSETAFILNSARLIPGRRRRTAQSSQITQSPATAEQAEPTSPSPPSPPRRTPRRAR